jgi:serine/threonine protein kinase
MTVPTSSEAEREQRLNEILLMFVEATERGEPLDRRRYLAAYPEFAAELAQFFADRDRVERLAAPLRDGRRASRVAMQPSGVRSSAGGSQFTNAINPRAGSSSSAPPSQRPLAASSAPGQRSPIPPVKQPLGSTSPPGRQAADPSLLGDFRLLKQIGRGGMGTVYEAYQLSLRRRVALKVLPHAAALDPRQLQRFNNEARAAASLHHPNIVPVYAVGCDRGVHYYAMQHIEGQSLAALIQGLRQPAPSTAPDRAAGTADQTPPLLHPGANGGKNLAATQGGGTSPVGLAPGLHAGTVPAAAVSSATLALSGERSSNRLTFFRRMAHLALTTADALEHAHQLGVVHRDIKPANLLLDGKYTLWITDFGLALLHNNAGLTTTGELVGTLRYMSPEQAGGKRGLVDHRTDIYSLGVTLYELLTLEPLFASNDSTQLLHQIACDEPRAPRSIDPTIPFELETIVLKALAKNPAERYATAQELADDLKLFLQDQPVQARRPTLPERIRKWARRHKLMVAWAAVLLVTTTAGLLASTILIARAHSETKAALDREQRKTEEAERQRTRAEANFFQARRAIDFLTQLSAEELVDEPDVLEVRRKLLEGALQYYQEFLDQHEDDPSIQKELAASQRRVAQILDDLSAQEDYLQLTLLLMLLREKEVQDDLHLGRNQKEQIAALSGRLAGQRYEALHTIRQLPEKERLKKFKEIADGNKKFIDDILSPGQNGRLKQIALQQKGPQAFTDPEVVKKLSLDKKQKALIRAILEKSRKDLAARTFQAPQNFEQFLRQAKHHWGKKGKEKKESRVDKIWKEATAKVLGVVTPKQKAIWLAMVGEPFEGPVYRPLVSGFVSSFPDSNGAEDQRVKVKRHGGEHSKWEGNWKRKGHRGTIRIPIIKMPRRSQGRHR